MREDSPETIIIEVLHFIRDHRLDFYEPVRVILENSQCAIITRPYWTTVDGKPGAEVFTIFPNLECKVCDAYQCKDINEFTIHMIDCCVKMRGLKADASILYKKYRLVPKSVKEFVDSAREKRDNDAVCVAPVLDHSVVKQLADAQRKDRERKKSEIFREEVAEGPNGPIMKLAKGAEMPLDRMVWIQTPLTSDLATLLLAGMQPFRHSPTGIHIPIILRETGITKVIHLHVEKLEELDVVRMAEESWELMKVELQNGVLRNKPEASDGHVVPHITDSMADDPHDSSKKITGRNLNFKQPNDPITEKKSMQNITAESNSDRRRVGGIRSTENGIDNNLAENEATKLARTAHLSDEARKSNGSCLSSRRLDDSLDERPGCSKNM